jgi:hypothetical protein
MSHDVETHRLSFRNSIISTIFGLPFSPLRITYSTRMAATLLNPGLLAIARETIDEIADASFSRPAGEASFILPFTSTTLNMLRVVFNSTVSASAPIAFTIAVLISGKWPSCCACDWARAGCV